jgi:hypothetical protein
VGLVRAVGHAKTRNLSSFEPPEPLGPHVHSEDCQPCIERPFRADCRIRHVESPFWVASAVANRETSM